MTYNKWVWSVQNINQTCLNEIINLQLVFTLLMPPGHRSTNYWIVATQDLQLQDLKNSKMKGNA